MSEERIKDQILEVWNTHVSSVRKEVDGDGHVINAIDDSRLYAIEVVKIIIHNFMKGDFDINDFKTALDSYNKHNNLWGFTAKLGQMYFNQIIKSNESNLEKLSTMLKELITEPKNIRDALSKIEVLEKHTLAIYTKSRDKHNAPYPGAVGFFLSYFWQIYNPQKWPILYGTLINSFRELGIWEDQNSQRDTYEHYYSVYNDIKKTVEDASGRKVSYWELEHAFWNYKPKPQPTVLQNTETEMVQSNVKPVETVAVQLEKPASPAPDKAVLSEGLDLREYLIPRLSRLLDSDFKQEAAQPENRFEQLVAEAFSQLDFRVEILDQSKQKDAFAILRFREGNVTFIVDAVPSCEDYFSSTDRRLIKEYVNDNCIRLKEEGYQKIGYLLVCNAFDPQYQPFVSYINWNTDIRKATLLSTEALLYMLAYKLKHRHKLMSLVERIAGFSQVVSSENIAAELSH